MMAEQIIDTDGNYIEHTYARMPLVVERARGATLYDTDGREFIDLGSGIGVNALGHGDEGWIRAVTKQAGKLAHLSNLYYSEPGGTLAQMLCERTGAQKVFLCNSGAEANECAIKCARKYSSDRYGPGRSAIVTLKNSFHGRTLATLSATGQDVFHQHFAPFPEGFRYVDAADVESAAASLQEGGVCAVMLELIQGEGGVVPLSEEFVRRVADICAANDILLLADEVQTGAGRTGNFLCSEQYRIKPDIVTLAKGLGGGLPIGAALFGEKTAGVLGAGDHGSTFGGNPVACAGAAEVVSRLTPELLEQVRKKGGTIRRTLEGLKNVRAVYGMGLMIGATLREGLKASDVARRGIEQHQVVALTAKGNIRLLPPLTISWEELETGLERLSACIESF